MARYGHREVDAHLVELVPARVFPDGGLLIAHGVAPEDGGLPVGLSIAHYQLEADGRTLRPMVIDGRPQQIAMHKAGAERSPACSPRRSALPTPPAGSA